MSHSACAEGPPRLHCYAFFHLNLCYSSIETAERAAVIRRCYHPLLELASRDGLPLGIELSGETLLEIQRLDPAWIAAFRDALAANRCELIGSGYAQVIGPLAPASVNRRNQQLGVALYREILGVRPRLALVNEQAYSRGLIAHYLEAGYEGIIMEWNNPASAHPEWPPELRYRPQPVTDDHGVCLPVVWNDAIAFQQFQRHAHGEIDGAAYLAFLARHVGAAERLFPLYGNDAEIFDFRPGRYATEAPLDAVGEWARIRALVARIRRDERFLLILPSRALDFMDASAARHPISLEHPAQPIPVKKQRKYNITRWAVTGRDDLRINTACHRCVKALEALPAAEDALWARLISLFGSDYRTHITEARWRRFCAELSDLERRLGVSRPASAFSVSPKPAAQALPEGVTVVQQASAVVIETDDIRAVLNPRRGLAFESLCFKAVSTEPLCGTLSHGFFDDIGMGADFYTGHLVYESPGLPKVTDLARVAPTVTPDNEGVAVTCTVPSLAGPILKKIRVTAKSPEVEVVFGLRWPRTPFGSLRLGHITLHPARFDRRTLFFETHNGGARTERFQIRDAEIDHGAPVSFLVSAQHALGITEGVFAMGDAAKQVVVEMDRRAGAMVGLVTLRDVGDRYFFRFSPSAQELDETCLRDDASRTPFHEEFRFRIFARRTDAPAG